MDATPKLTLAQKLRALCYQVFMLSTVLILCPLVLLCLPFPFAVRYRLATYLGRWNLYGLQHICGIHYRVRGLENIPQVPCIFLSKHQSSWEALAYQHLFPVPLRWVIKRELLWIPIFGWALSRLKPIAINRNAGKQAVSQIIEQGKLGCEQGLSVMVFPEGTRVRPGEPSRYGMGGAILAEKTGAPVVPVAHNSGHFFGRGSLEKYPGTVELVLGPVIHSHGRAAREILLEAEAWIESEMKKLPHPRSKTA